MFFCVSGNAIDLGFFSRERADCAFSKTPSANIYILSRRAPKYTVYSAGECERPKTRERERERDSAPLSPHASGRASAYSVGERDAARSLSSQSITETVYTICGRENLLCDSLAVSPKRPEEGVFFFKLKRTKETHQRNEYYPTRRAPRVTPRDVRNQSLSLWLDPRNILSA